MEAGRVSVAVEVTGLDKAGADLSKFDAATQRAGNAGSAAFSGMEKAAKQASATVDREMKAAGLTVTGMSKTAAAGLKELERAQAAVVKSTAGVSDAIKGIAQATAPAKKSLEELRAQFNPLFSIGQAYRKEVDAIRAAHDAGALSVHEMNNALQRASVVAMASQNAYSKVRDQVEIMGGAAKLTGDQVRNLGFQLNDAVTMLLSGSSPFQVLATQGGQVVQALDGPAGVRGSIAAITSTISSFVMGLGPAGAALGALTAGAVAFGLAIRKDVEPVDAIIKRQSASVRELRDAYGLASSASEDYGRRAAKALAFEAKQDYEKGLAGLKGRVGQFEEQFFAGRDNYARRNNAPYEPIRQAFLDLRKSAAEGMPDFIRFQNVLAEIAETDPTSSFWDGHYVRELAKQMREVAEEGARLQVSLEGVKTVTDEAAVSAERMKAAYANAMDELQGLIPDLRTQAQQINDAFAKAAAGPADGDEMVARFQQQKALAADAAGAVELLNAARAEGAAIGLGEEAKAVAAVEQEYAKLKAQYAGNTQALIDLEKWRAQAIDNAGAQAAFDRQQEQAKEQEAAAKRAAAEAERYAQATRSRIAGIDQTVAAQRMEIDLLGRSEGEAAALRFEFQALTAARQAAASAGKVVSDEEIAAIRQAAGEVGALTTQFKAMQEAQEQAKRLGEMFDDLTFERSIIGLSDAEQRVRESIHGLGVDYDSFDGQRLAGELRYNDALRQSQDEMRRTGEIAEDAFGGLIDALTQGGDLMQNLMGLAADLGRQFASMGAQKLFGNLFGTGQAANDNVAGIGALFSGGGRAAPITAQAPVASAGSAAYGAVASAPMRALNDNLTKVGRSALDVAKQFNGLNERADSRVLDSFLRTSGNWKNLSAADTAWCAAFANAAIVQSGGKGTGSNLASSFMGWGTGTNAPKVGDIVVLKPQARGASGHVGFVAGFGDGTVQVYGGNQSSGANTKSFGLDQVRGYRTAGGPATARSATEVFAETRIVQRGVSEGMRDFTRQWGGTPSSQAQAAMANGSFDGFSHNGAGARQGLFSQNALGVLGAGFGAFGAGYQSGSPFSGGLSGALGGYQAGPAISSMLGVGGMAGSIIGGIGGAALGILGGILGARKQREQVHRQKAEAWEQLRPQYEAFDKSLSGDGNGQLRQWITAQEGQFAEFRKVGGDAWKYGSGNSSAQFASTGTKMWTRFMEMQAEFREGFTDMVEDLSSGEGLGGAFAKGRAATKDLKKQIRDMVDDVSIAFGSSDIGVGVSAEWEAASKTMEEQRNKAIAEAKVAAGEYALSLLYTASTTSEVEKSLDGFRGTAAGLQKILTDLGWTAEAAAADIDERLTQAIAKMGETFTEGFQSQINDLSDKGYLNDIADLVKSRDTGLNDAKLLGVDPSIVTKWFTLAVQDVVDGADLTADAFEELKKQFPALADVALKASTAMADAARSRFDMVLAERAEAESALRAEYERTIDRIAGIKDFLSDMALDDDLSTLSGKEQFDAAQKAYRETLFKANGGDRDAQDKLLGVSQDYLDEAKAYYATSEAYGAVYKEIEATLKASASKMETELDVARRQASFLNDIAANTKGLSGLLSEFLKAQKNVDKAFGDVNANRDWGKNPDANRSMVSALAKVGLYYTGDFGKGGYQAWLDSLSTADRAKAKGAIGYRMGGLIPGYADGGMVGNGTWNVDSVLARYAGGGHIGLAGGEFVMPAPRVTPQTLPMLEGMRQGRMVGNDNRELVAALGRVEALLRTQVVTTGNGLARVEQATDRSARATERAALTTSREQSLRRTG